MRRTETQQWWRSEELRILLAHHLVDTGQITTTRALLAFYEAPQDWEAQMRECLREMAAGQLRPGVSLTQPVVDDIKARRRANESRRAIAEDHGMTAATVRDIEQGVLFPLEAIA